MAKKSKTPQSPTAKTATQPKIKLKEIEWLGHLPAMQALPPSMKVEGGKELHRLEIGEEPVNWRSMASIGAGANEIRLQDANGWYRIFYVAKFLKVIYILGIITKKTNATSEQDIENARVKYKEAAAENAIKKQALAATKSATKALPKKTKDKKP